MSGYSGTPLHKKLGYKAGFRVLTKNSPDEYFKWIQPLPEGVKFMKRRTTDLDLVHYFTKSYNELNKSLPVLKESIRSDGMIWISWPKRASKVETDITEDVIRSVALPIGLVDIKVCSVNETWSGLKLVIRKELR